MAIEAILFDLDGTLLDTLADIARAANLVLERHGSAAHPVRAYRTMVGSGMTELVRRAVAGGAGAGSAVDEAWLGAVGREIAAVYAEDPVSLTTPYEGIFDLLAALARRAPVAPVLAVLSNKPHHLTTRIVDSFFPTGTFRRTLGHIDGVPPKPDPTSARGLLADLGVHSRAVYVGDSDVDVQTAHAAGMHAIGAAWGFRGRAELVAAGARWVIDHPLEIVSVLEAIESEEEDHE